MFKGTRDQIRFWAAIEVTAFPQSTKKVELKSAFSVCTLQDILCDKANVFLQTSKSNEIESSAWRSDTKLHAMFL